MADLLSAALLGIVEGVTEFLPISSTGHLIVTAELLRFGSASAFEIIIQFGAVVAVIWFYHQQLLKQARQLPSERDVQRFWLNILIAFVPAAAFGLLLGGYIERVLFSPQVVAFSLIGGGVVLWFAETLPRRQVTYETVRISRYQALLVGLAQVAALIPGVSRSGATIVGGMISGMNRTAATGFSFYLAIPTLGAATLYSLVKDLGTIDDDLLALVIGAGMSFATSLIAMGWLLRYISEHSFRGFAIYRILAGIVILLIFGLP